MPIHVHLHVLLMSACELQERMGNGDYMAAFQRIVMPIAYQVCSLLFDSQTSSGSPASKSVFTVTLPLK